MRKVRSIILLVLLGCQTSNNSNTVKIDFADDSILVLPEISKWKESYSNANVRKRFDEYSNANTTLLGIYLENEILDKKDYLNKDFKQYAIFYIINDDYTKSIENVDLEKIFKNQSKKLELDTCEIKEVMNNIQSDSTFLSLGEPCLVNAYKRSNDIFSSVQLIKPFPNENSDIKVFIYNLININNHLIYGGYYNDFDNVQSIKESIENNDIIMSEFLKVNSL